MANNILFTNGTITSSAAEQTLFDVIADKYFSTHLFCHNMQAGDSIVVRLYIKDVNAGTLRLHTQETISGVQTAPDWYLHLIPTPEYKVTIQRTGGVDRAYTWLRAEI